MFSEFAIAEIYMSPFFIYACITIPVCYLLRIAISRSELLRKVWHPALFEFALSLIVVSLFTMYL